MSRLRSQAHRRLWLLVLPDVRLVGVRVKAVNEAPSLFPATALDPLPASLPVLDSRARDAVFYEQPVSSVINPPESTGMGFWSINPYVGCEFGCTYCYARFTHRYTVQRAEDAGKLGEEAMGAHRGPDAWKAFEHRIFVKRKEAVLAAMERDLARIHRRRVAGESIEIVLGTATDPYQPGERSYQLSRAILERLSHERGLSIGIISKSPLIARDVDILSKIQEHNRLCIDVSLISVDVQLIRVLEARSPMPHARLRGLARLVEAGLNAGLIVAPILPAINDSVSQLDALLGAAREAGARFAHPSPLRLYASIREHFLPVIESHFPHLARRYREAYRGLGLAPRRYAKALSQRFRMVAARHHIPVSRREPSETVKTQLGLWS